MKNSLVGLLLMSLCSGCGVFQPGVVGSGVLQSEIRPVGSFDQINLSGMGTVQVVVGEAPSVEVATDDNLLPLVETDVTDGILNVRTRGTIRTRSGVNINVTVPHLTATRVSGAGDMHIHDLSSDAMEMTISGAGSLKADGFVKNLRARISGAGDADLRDLVTHSTDIRVSGAGDATVFALESLSAKVSGAGDVTCFGNPEKVHQQISGAGDVNIREDPTTRVIVTDEPPAQKNKSSVAESKKSHRRKIR